MKTLKTGKSITPSTVMFVPSSRGGILTAKLREREDHMASMTGFRMRFQEAGGMQLGKLFSTDLARDIPCGRQTCWPCRTSKEKRVRKGVSCMKPAALSVILSPRKHPAHRTTNLQPVGREFTWGKVVVPYLREPKNT